MEIRIVGDFNSILIHKEFNYVTKMTLDFFAEFCSKIVAENSAPKKLVHFVWIYHFCPKVHRLRLSDFILCELGFFGKLSEFFLNSNFWKYCLNSDEISKFSVLHFGQVVWMCFVNWASDNVECMLFSEQNDVTHSLFLQLLYCVLIVLSFNVITVQIH